MRLYRFSVGFLTALILLLPVTSLAQVREQAIDPVLRQLYTESLQLRGGTNAALETRIKNERARVKREELAALQTLVNAANVEGEGKSALDQQRSLVELLDARRQGTEVDLELLSDEEEVLHDRLETATGSLLTGLIRRQVDLLAKRAVLEERLAADEEVLAQQRTRLDRLENQARSQQFADFVQIGTYLGILVLIVVAERFIRGQLLGRIRDRNRRYLSMKLFTGTVYFLLIGAILYRLYVDYPGIVTSFAIVGAGIAVALQSIIKDIVGWIIIVQKRLFTLGQRVTIGPHTGDVADISLFRTTLVEIGNTETKDVSRVGQSLFIPNSMVLDRPVLNYHASSDFMETELTITIVPSSDWRKAEQLLQQILDVEVGPFVERARIQYILRTAHFFAAQEPPGPRVFIAIVPDGIQFTLRFQVPIGQRRTVSAKISREILDKFGKAEPAIELIRKA